MRAQIRITSDLHLQTSLDIILSGALVVHTGHFPALATIALWPNSTSSGCHDSIGIQSILQTLIEFQQCIVIPIVRVHDLILHDKMGPVLAVAEFSSIRDQIAEECVGAAFAVWIAPVVNDRRDVVHLAHADNVS